MTIFDREPGKAQELAEALSGQAQGGAMTASAKLGSPIGDPVVVSALYYQVAREPVGAYREQLAGKILVDISNPVNQSGDDLATPPGVSAAEELAGLAPSAQRCQTGRPVVQCARCLRGANHDTGPQSDTRDTRRLCAHQRVH